MDSVSQRRLAAASFVIVWAVKVPLLLSSDVQQFGISCFLDLLYFVALYRADIPWMRMSRCGTLLLILGSWILNMGLLGSQTSLEHQVKSPVKESHKVFEGNIIGSHQVHVRPPTIVKLNPNASAYCASMDIFPRLNVLIKGNPPWIIEFKNSLDDLASKFNLTVDASNLTDPANARKIGSKSYSLQVNRLGKFEISAIYEVKTGDLGKIIPSFAEIVKCPVAKWKSLDLKRDVCLQSSSNIDIILQGIPPLSIWISKKYDSSPSVVDLLSIGSREDGAGTFSTTVKIQIQKLNDWKLSILRVSDGNQNTIDYGTNDDLKNSLPSIVSKSSYFVLDSLPDFEISARSLPNVQFSNCESSQKIKMDPHGQKHIESLQLPLKISGDGSWKIKYRVEQEDEVKPESFEYETDKTFIEAAFPGTYVLTDIHDSFCKGNIIEPSKCDVIANFPPTLSIASTPIESACIGAIGLTANLSFTGDPPFWIDVQQELLQTGIKRLDRFKNLKSRHVMRFEPSDGNGTYRYSFLKIGDAIYTDGISLNLPPITQVIHSFPSASITLKSQQIKCLNDSARVSVVFEGSGPWSLSYEIMHDQYKKQYSMQDIFKRKITIDTPPLLKSGLHVFSLTEVTDSNGCSKLLDSQDLSIEVLPHRPAVSFSSEQPVFFRENSMADLPLTVSGRGEVEITYVKIDAPLEEFKMSGPSQNLTAIVVESPNQYQLTSIHDSFCRGIVLKPNQLSAFWIPKPSFSIIDGENLKPPICVGSQDFVQIKMQGSPPFTIFYIHNFTQIGGDPSNISEKKQVISQPQVFDENSREYTGYIYLESAKSGTNTYHFLSIIDSNYDTPIRLGNSLSIEQRVDAAPTAEFVDNQDITFHCLSEKPGEVVLPIKLTGIAPFVLTLQKRYDHGEIERFSITVDDQSILVKNGSSIFQYEPEKILLIGSYTFDIISVQDSTSCEVHYQNDSPGLDSLKSISIHIVDQAKVMSNNPSVLCVGDMLTYGLQGTAPFTIGYSWNGISMKDLVVTDPILTLFAAEPGILSIDKICNSMMCCAQTSGTSIVEIKDIPSAIVDGGEDIIEDIREGEESVMVVEFKGTPPFSISWSRSEIGEDKQSDSFSVSNIETFRYSISTQQEGIFTVTAVSDKVIGFKINTQQYCSFPRAVQDSSLANAILKSG